MLNNLQPWQILLSALAGWINRHQLIETREGTDQRDPNYVGEA